MGTLNPPQGDPHNPKHEEVPFARTESSFANSAGAPGSPSSSILHPDTIDGLPSLHIGHAFIIGLFRSYYMLFPLSHRHPILFSDNMPLKKTSYHVYHKES